MCFLVVVVVVVVVVTANHSIVINSADSSDSASYRCEATNKLGESSSIISIVIDGNFSCRLLKTEFIKVGAVTSWLMQRLV